MMVGCYAIVDSKVAFGNFALLMLHEALIMTLTLWIGIKKYRHSRSILITNLYRNGILYLIGILLISAGNIVVILAGPPEFRRLFNTFQRIMHSMLSTRIMLHVRQMTLPKEQLTTLPTVRFHKPRSSSSSSATGKMPDATIISAHAKLQMNSPSSSSL